MSTDTKGVFEFFLSLLQVYVLDKWSNLPALSAVQVWSAKHLFLHRPLILKILQTITSQLIESVCLFLPLWRWTKKRYYGTCSIRTRTNTIWLVIFLYPVELTLPPHSEKGLLPLTCVCVCKNFCFLTLFSWRIDSGRPNTAADGKANQVSSSFSLVVIFACV